MSCESKKTDGVLTFVIDDEIEKSFRDFPEDKLVYRDNVSGDIHLISATVLWHIFEILHKCQQTEFLLLQSEGIFAEGTLDYYEDKVRIYEGAIENCDLPPSIIQSIIRGNVDLVFLLDTIGGYASLGELIERISKHVRVNAGRVAAFVGKKASSAGLAIFSEADREHRYIRGDTLLLHHLPDTAVRTLTMSDPDEFESEFLQDEIETYRERYMNLINNADSAADTINEALNDPKNPDAAITLNAVASHYLGVASVVPSLTRKFEDFVGITDLDEGFGETEVAEFFRTRDTATASEFEKFEAVIVEDERKKKFLTMLGLS